MIVSVSKIKNNPTVKKFLLVSSICSALVTFYNMGNIWNLMGWPRPVFTSEYNLAINAMQRGLLDLEIDYRRRAIIYDQTALRHVLREISQFESMDTVVPESIMDLQIRLEERLRMDRDRLEVLEAASKTP
jgi:hypothetical protein